MLSPTERNALNETAQGHIASACKEPVPNDLQDDIEKARQDIMIACLEEAGKNTTADTSERSRHKVASDKPSLAEQIIASGNTVAAQSEQSIQSIQSEQPELPATTQLRNADHISKSTQPINKPQANLVNDIVVGIVTRDITRHRNNSV